MECIVLVGLQGSGKSTLYKLNWADSHVRINLDMLNGNRNRETVLLMACLAMKQSFVVDNTNLTARERQRYIDLAKASGYDVWCHFIDADFDTCLKRNASRTGRGRVPEAGIRAARGRLQVPNLHEGWDDIWIHDGGEVKTP